MRIQYATRDRSESPDYDAVDVPDEKTREYGVSHTSIGRGFDALGGYVAENRDRDRSSIRCEPFAWKPGLGVSSTPP